MGNLTFDKYLRRELYSQTMNNYYLLLKLRSSDITVFSKIVKCADCRGVDMVSVANLGIWQC